VPAEDAAEAVEFIDMTDYYRLANGGSAHLKEYDDNGKTLAQLVLDAAALQRGLALMAQQKPHMFADLVTEDGDSNTADVFLQYCLLGEIRYG